MQNGKTSLKVSEEIELRLPDIEYADELFYVIDSNRKHLENWLSWVNATISVTQVKEFLRNSRIFNKGGQRLTTFIFYKKQISGSVALVKIDKENNCAEIGYWLKEDLQSHGIVSQSCKTLVDYVFNHMEINRLEIKVAMSNTKSLAIPYRLGFTKEACLKEALLHDGIYHDLALFRILKKEWLLQ